MSGPRLGQVFTELRTLRGWTQDEMASQLTLLGIAITRYGVSKIESRGTQQFALMKAYGAIFGMTVEQLHEMAQAAA